MKQFFIALSALFTCFVCEASAQSEHKVSSAVDSNEYTYDYYYNAKNQLAWMDFGTTHRVYAYNEAGQLVEMKQYAWVDGLGEYNLLQTETYEYGADGNVSKKTVEKKAGVETYEYSDYENGVAKKTKYNDRDKYLYDWRTTIEYNDDKTIAATRTEEFDYDYPEDGFYKLEDYEYTYAGGYRASETKIAYKFDGSVRSTLVTNFTYADFDAKYVPANLKAECGAQVTLTWDPVEGTNSYMVNCEGNSWQVEGCSFRTVLRTGSHTVSVRAEVDGLLRNASFVDVDVVDPGKLPVATFAVGDVYETVEETESEEAPTRTFYNIPFSWTLPENHSEVVKYNIYYDSYTYGKDVPVAVTNPAATSYVVKLDPFEVAEWDEEGNLGKGLDVPFYMTVVYTTGESEKSEVIIVNPHRLLGHEGESAIQAPSIGKDSRLYNLSGQRTSRAKGVVVKAGKKFMMK